MFSLKTLLSLLFTSSLVFAHGDHGDHDHDHSEEEKTDVVVLTDGTSSPPSSFLVVFLTSIFTPFLANFKEFVEKTELSLIEFYARKSLVGRRWNSNLPARLSLSSLVWPLQSNVISRYLSIYQCLSPSLWKYANRVPSSLC